MTVASPTTGMALVPPLDASRAAVTCVSCSTTSDGREPYCAHCGARIPLAVAGRRPAAVAATRSLQFAALTVVANLLVGGVAFGIVYLISDAAHLTQAALGLELLKFLIVETLAVFAVRYGIRGIRETTDSRVGRRSWAVLGIVIGGLFGLLVALSFAATLYLTLIV